MRRLGIGSIRARADRLRRRCGFDHNDLRRDVDRKQRLIALGLIVFYLGATPIAAAKTGQLAYDRGIRTERHETSTRHLVTATVIEPGSQRLETRRATWVTWTEPDGTTHTGATIIWRGERRIGERQKIWINTRGQPTVPPRTRSQTVIDGWATAMATSIGVALPLLAIYTLLRQRYDRRRDRDWDTAWARLDTHSTN